jgi:putative ABC transport system substrate-binding protein
MRELNWVDGRNIGIEYRWGEGRSERFAEIAAEFVRLKVDVIVTSGAAAVLAARQATSAIPIVLSPNKRAANRRARRPWFLRGRQPPRPQV